MYSNVCSVLPLCGCLCVPSPIGPPPVPFILIIIESFCNDSLTNELIDVLLISLSNVLLVEEHTV